MCIRDRQPPVPFAEYVPYKDFFRRFSDKVDLVRYGMATGTRIGYFELTTAASHPGDPRTFAALPTICFEVAYDSLVRASVTHQPDVPSVLVVQTNNATFGYTAESAQHSNPVTLRARPRKPQDKAKVESGVQVVERWILARLRHRRFFSVAELDAAILELLPALNTRPFKKLPGSRQEAFGLLDAPYLRPLPVAAFVIAEWKKATVNIDYHVEFDGSYYSVPHALVRQAVELRITRRTVEVLARGKRVASHPRSPRKGHYATLAEHMPAAHRAHAEWSPGKLMAWATSVGPATAELVKRLLMEKRHPEQGYRACLGLMRLTRNHGRTRMEAACERALAVGAHRSRSAASILDKGRDRQPLAPQQAELAWPG